jgi:hypothetical protein
MQIGILHWCSFDLLPNKMHFRSLALLATSIASLTAQNFFITSPVQTTSWKAGETVKISWNPADKPAIQATKIDIELVNGDSNNANFVQQIASGLDATAKSFDFKVPDTLAPATDYFLRMSGVAADGKKSYNFSSRFSILGGKGASATNATAKATPTTTATASTPSKSPVPSGNLDSGVSRYTPLLAFLAVPYLML